MISCAIKVGNQVNMGTIMEVTSWIEMGPTGCA